MLITETQEARLADSLSRKVASILLGVSNGVSNQHQGVPQTAVFMIQRGLK